MSEADRRPKRGEEPDRIRLRDVYESFAVPGDPSYKKVVYGASEQHQLLGESLPLPQLPGPAGEDSRREANDEVDHQPRQSHARLSNRERATIHERDEEDDAETVQMKVEGKWVTMPRAFAVAAIIGTLALIIATYPSLMNMLEHSNSQTASQMTPAPEGMATPVPFEGIVPFPTPSGDATTIDPASQAVRELIRKDTGQQVIGVGNGITETVQLGQQKDVSFTIPLPEGRGKFVGVVFLADTNNRLHAAAGISCEDTTSRLNLSQPQDNGPHAIVDMPTQPMVTAMQRNPATQELTTSGYKFLTTGPQNRQATPAVEYIVQPDTSNVIPAMVEGGNNNCTVEPIEQVPPGRYAALVGIISKDSK